MRKLVLVIAALAAIAATTAPAAQEKKSDASVAGAWTLTIKGPAAHGDLQATLELRQDGRKITGTFHAHGNAHAVAGEFADGSLSLDSTDTAADRALSFTAKLKSDGTLAGYVSSPMGDMQFTGKKQA